MSKPHRERPFSEKSGVSFTSKIVQQTARAHSFNNQYKFLAQWLFQHLLSKVSPCFSESVSVLSDSSYKREQAP
eukprot:1975997-Amphidinium_carterae.1